jgi:large subunit ribosomal protein L29
MKTAELRKLDVDALNAEMLKLREEQLKLNIKKATVPNTPLHRLQEIRKAIARIKTLLTEMKSKKGDK